MINFLYIDNLYLWQARGATQRSDGKCGTFETYYKYDFRKNFAYFYENKPFIKANLKMSKEYAHNDII